MKKIGMIISILCISLLVGCSSTGKYKEGVYQKEVPDNYGGQENTAIAEVTVDSKGKISKVVLDTTYTTNDGKTQNRVHNAILSLFGHDGEWAFKWDFCKEN